MNKSAKKKQQWLTSLPEGAFKFCPWCQEALDAGSFWDSKKRRPSKVCKDCLSARRRKAAVKKGKWIAPNYQDYINSSAWQQKRLEYWKSKKMRQCYVCDSPWLEFKGKQLHHITYERLGRESLDDLVPVCPPCHEIITDAWNEEKLVSRKDRMTLQEVTDLVALDFKTMRLISPHVVV